MDRFIESLKSKLQRPLPGKRAHNLMMPRTLSGNGFEVRNSKEPRAGAVLILFYKIPGGIYFPLIQRPDYPGVHGGQIGLPGGKKEPSDEDLIQTALRESHEEIGVPPQEVEVIGALSEFYVSASNHRILPVVGYSTGIPTFIPDHIEVAEVIEAPVSELTDAGSLKEKEMNIRGFSMITPYFDIRGKVVWGATAMMLSELYTLLKEK